MHKRLVLIQINNETFKAKIRKIKCPKSAFGVATTRCNKCYFTTWNENHVDFEYLIMEENSMLLLWAVKVRVLKLQDVDHERDAN